MEGHCFGKDTARCINHAQRSIGPTSIDARATAHATLAAMNYFNVVRASLIAGALAACGTPHFAEQYGFIARLGNDTVSVERVTRSPRSLVSDDVDRFPLVRRRHTVIDLDGDGRVTRLEMDIQTPSGASPGERYRKVTATYTRDSVAVAIRDSNGVASRTFRTAGALAVPHVSMQYSVIELEIAFALAQAKVMKLAAGDSVGFRQYYPDRSVGPSFVLHSGYVHLGRGDSVELKHDWLAGSGDVIVDSSGRMQRYSGMRSTYKVSVQRVADLPDVERIGAAFAATEKRQEASQLSVRDTARGQIGGTTFAIDYGRPLMRGRVLLGNVIALDDVWRTGANAATQFTTSSAITIGTLTVPAGSYTLWTKPTATGVTLIVNRETGQWGTGFDYREDLGRTPMRVDTTSTPVEKFTIAVTSSDARRGELVMEWGTFRWRAPITVTSR